MLTYFRIPFPPQQLFNLSLWLIEIEINMLDEKLVKFLALQRIHQLFPSRVQASPGSVGAHPLASGGHHTEGAHAHICHHTTPLDLPSVCVNSRLLSMENLSFQYLSPPCMPLLGLIKHRGFFSQKAETRWQPQLSEQARESLL